MKRLDSSSEIGVEELPQERNHGLGTLLEAFGEDGDAIRLPPQRDHVPWRKGLSESHRGPSSRRCNSVTKGVEPRNDLKLSKVLLKDVES